MGLALLGTGLLTVCFLRLEGVFGVAGLTALAASRQAGSEAQAAVPVKPTITVDYPQEGAIFPPDMVAPTFLWRDAEASARSWRIDVSFADRRKAIHLTSQGEGMKIGAIDPLCVSTANRPPFLTPEQAAAHTWKPEADAWALIKKHSVRGTATVEITGLDEAGRTVSEGRVALTTSVDPVGAPIF